MKDTTQKILAALSAAAVLASGGLMNAYADEAQTPETVIVGENAQSVLTVDHGYAVGSMIVGENDEYIVSEDGNLTLAKDDGAFVLDAKGEKKSFDDVKAGDKLTFYVDGDKPAELIYPPRYTPDVIVIEDEEAAVSRKIAVFDENHLSDDGELVINYDPSTPYYSKTREAAFISGKALVFYNFATMSIPAQTNPLAIVRLNGDAEGLNTTEMKPITTVPLGKPESVVDHGYIVGGMIVGENRGGISNEGGDICLYKTVYTHVLSDRGEELSFDDIKTGDHITYYVNGDAPAKLLSPDHYYPEVIVVEKENSDSFRKLAVFDEELISDDNELKLNMNPDVPYYSKIREYSKALETNFPSGKALVFYDITTRSIPAQTTPLAVVKLTDDEVSAAAEGETPDLSAVKAFLVDKDGDYYVPYIPVTVDGVQMIPVRELAESLGFTVGWDGETNSVTVGQASFTIDVDSYSFAKAAPRQLGQAPVLIALPGEDTALTYVPVSFFTDVLGYTIEVSGGDVVPGQVARVFQ